MKKYFLLLVLLTANVLVYSQSSQSVMTNPISLYALGGNGNNQVLSGQNFQIGVQFNCPNNCTSQTITVFIGNLEYTGSNNVLPNNALISYNVLIQSVVITGITCSTSQTLNFGVRFPAGTCSSGTGSSVSLQATLTSIGCSPAVINQQSDELTITALNSDPILYLTQESAALLCVGSVVKKYTIQVYNQNSGGRPIADSSLKFTVADCATIVGVYKGSTYEAVTYSTFSPSPKTIKIDIGNLAVSTFPSYDIYVSFPCSSCNTSVTFTPTAKFEGTYSTCGLESVTKVTSLLPQSLNPTQICNNDCNYVGGGTANLIKYSGVFPCPVSCNPTSFEGTYDLNIPPGYTYTTFEFTTIVPQGMVLNSIYNINFSAGCSGCTLNGGHLQAFVNDSTTPLTYSSGTTITIPAVTTKIRWRITPLIPNSPLMFKAIYNFTYNTGTPPPPAPNSIVSISGNYKFDSGSAIDFFASPGVWNNNLTIPTCSSVVCTKLVKQADSVGNFTTLLSVDPNSQITYQLRIENNGGNTVSNLVVTDVLTTGNLYLTNLNIGTEENPIYIRNFKYAYQVNEPTDSQWITLGTDNKINIPDLFSTSSVSPTVTSLPSDMSSGNITISNLNFPNGCNDGGKMLYIQFNTKLNPFLTYTSNVINECTASTSSGVLVHKSNTTTVSVNQKNSLSCSMFAKCPDKTEWLKTVNVRNNEYVDFKIVCRNNGSKAVFLQDILNLKPMVNDKYVTDPAISRGSQFNVNYKCEQPALNSNLLSVNPPPYQIRYSNTDVNMERVLYPNTIPGAQSGWNENCVTNDSKWMRISFITPTSTNGILLHAGEYVEITYKGKVMPGTSTDITTAYNSFSFRGLFNGGNVQIISPEIKDVTIINDGKGCNEPCIDCASFGLIKGEKYLVSGWVKEESTDDPSKQFKSYSNSFINVTFKQETTNAVLATYAFAPSGDIIDGWQRIIGEITVPGDETIRVGDMILELKNDDKYDKVLSFFDDIRVLPTKGNMKSFVYDQKTQRLMAELDENNYSTFYEYDLEGGLIRIKKETEKGVFTIQETRSGNVKSNR
jgi:uncharacterized repeat protein (TIGR01451 family)